MPEFNDGRRDDTNGIVRASMTELSNPEWWKSLEIDAVAFICWGFREHTAIIRAAGQAGVKTCAIFDTSCCGYPYFNIWSTIVTFWRKGFLSESLPRRLFGTTLRIGIFFFQGLFSNYHAYVQARAADFSFYNSTSSFERAKRRARIFGGGKTLSKMVLMGYPIPDSFSPRPLTQRKQKIIAVARWDAVRHKRPDVLMRVAEQVVARNHDIVFEIFGRMPERMRVWHDNLQAETQSRIILAGLQPISRVTEVIGEGMIFYCPSAVEGVPLPVVEALCGGCTVVGLKTDDIPGLAWAFREGDGTPVLHDTIDAHVDALLMEMKIWQGGTRNPLEISQKWSHWFSATSYARRLAGILTRSLPRLAPTLSSDIHFVARKGP